MREIGTIQEEIQAKRFGDYLLMEGIENQIEEEDGLWIVWVVSEENVSKAKELFARFRKDPSILESDAIVRKASRLRERQKQEEASYQKLRRKNKIRFRTATGGGRLTQILIIISVAVSLLSLLGTNQLILRFLFISLSPGLREVFHGQIWRLITPIFIHYGPFHLLFNMLWLYYLGSAIENIHGIKVFTFLVLTIGVISNLGQYFVSGPGFGGMSGVVYGLLGYIWIRGRFDPLSGLHLENWIVVWMIVWFLLGLTGLIGHIANTAHGVGLGVGMFWGYVFARISPTTRIR